VLPIPLPAQGKLGGRRAREIKTASAGKRRTKTKTITIKLPTVLIEAIDELVKVGPYTSRAAAIRSVLVQEVPRHLAKYQAIDEVKELPAQGSNTKRTNISIFMPRKMFVNLDKMAKELEISRSELVRVAIDKFYREYQGVFRK
jgi:metal-responsive CopG/Arc/MetJ family transcriptional regulator